MLPLYKLLSLFLRVLSRPFINFTKRYYSNSDIKRDWVRRQFLKMGTWFHTWQHRINRRYLRVDDTKTPTKLLGETQAVDKGIQLFYEILFYSIALGYPSYQLYRQVVDSKAKDAKLSNRVNKLAQNLARANQQHQTIQTALHATQWTARHLAFEICSEHLLFCLEPSHEQLASSAQLLKKQAPWMAQFDPSARKGYAQLLASY